MDVVAVGFENGEIHILNLLYNETLTKFTQTGGAIKSLSFSSATDMEVSLLASIVEGSPEVVLWDLNKKAIYAKMPVVHSGKPINDVQFLANEPVIVTSSHEGNSLKMWLFENGNVTPRLLRQRSGHASQPCKIRFYGG